MRNLRLVYKIHDKPIPLIKVMEGLWIAQEEEYTDEERAADYFKSSELFKKPMIKKGKK